MLSSFRSIIVFGLIGICLSLSTFAYTPRDIANISLISRSARGANESLRFKKAPLSGEVQNEDKDESSITTTITNSVVRNSYLKLVFPEQYLVDSVIKNDNGKDLLWSYGYHYSKSRIMIHHTVTDLNKIKTSEDAKKAIQDIFAFHTINRGRGDIGYNFIIDNFGNIYEGRAGGEGIIAAHAKYNNTDSIGIALLGNFEINKPTEKQLEALTKLVTALSVKYRINPDNQVYAHIEDDEGGFPFVDDVVRPVIMGHRDTGKTACPGQNLYNQLATIRKNVKANLKKMNITIPITKLTPIYTYPELFFAPKDSLNITIPYPLSQKMRSCKLLTKDRMTASKCHHDGKNLTVTLTKLPNKKASGLHIIEIKTVSSHYKIVFNIKWNSDAEIERQERRELYEKSFGKLPIPPIASKKHSSISESLIPPLMTKPITILLYELSTAMKSWYVRCTNCVVTANESTILSGNSFRLKIKNNKLEYTSKTINSLVLDTLTLKNLSNTGRIYFSDYERTSYNGTPRNSFYGSIRFSQQPIVLLGQDTPTLQYIITNTVSLDQYMAGIVETNDTEPVEKNKVMALIARNYMLYYMDPSNHHPSIPSDASYNAIDDARIFQKYAGAGVSDTLTIWPKALKATKNQYVMYSGALAFLPYFSCSAGFTRSAAEKRGRSDTPYLRSVLDSEYCAKFDGHGVGLAGKGATSMARNGATYDQIIKYYYPGVTIQTIQ